MVFDITILGSSSATPTSKRNPSAQLLDIQGNLFLIDCGEGTQIKLRQLGKRFQKINHIFISHLHGDHFFGLFGLLSTMHLLGRKTPLHLYAYQELKPLLDQLLQLSYTELKYPLCFHEIPEGESSVLYSDKNVEVAAFPVKHSVPCSGFCFREKEKPLNVKKNIVELYDLDPVQIKLLKEGRNIVVEGEELKSKEVTYRSFKPRSYAYCTDTIYDEGLLPYIKGVDCLYHEATFLKDLAAAAKDKFHATAKEAALIAQKANVKQLILGHFSARYKDCSPFEIEAKEVFEEVVIAEDGQTYSIRKL